jgi:hypothetical protein
VLLSGVYVAWRRVSYAFASTTALPRSGYTQFQP